MPDYASILKRSISALPDPTPDMREAVYQRARAALARQLTAVEPPLSTREIETQHQELEDAVVRLESEFAPAEPSRSEEGASERKENFAYFAPPNTDTHAKALPAVAAAPVEPAATDIDSDEDEDFQDEEDRPSVTPFLVGLLLVVLVVVGIAAYAYAERSTILAFIGFGDSEESSAPGDSSSVATGVGPAANGDTPKVPDRLTNGTEVPPVDALTPGDIAMAEPDRPAGLPADDQLAIDTAPILPGEQTAALESPGTSLVEQRAIYYYQGSAGTPGQASEGTTTWVEISKDGRPAIQATLRVPERNVLVAVTIYKNYDTALPASHLVEIQFNGALGASPIQRVPALVLKPTEQARGQPLTGAAVPVTNELFWIALSDEEEYVARNIQLLREGSWFDIPILFSDQTRALLSFEKGIPGDRVFETVLSSWTPT